MNTSQLKLLGFLLIVIAVALGVLGARHTNRPAQFYASAIVKVERDKIDLPELGKGAPAGMDNTIIMQTEIELIQSETTLTKAIEKLNLNEDWGKRYNDGQAISPGETLQLLKGRLELQSHLGDTRITIKVASDEAGEAADIANAVAQAYCDYRRNYRRRLAQNALAELSEKFKVLEEKIAVAQTKVEKAGQELDPALRGTAIVTNQPESEKLESFRNRYSTSLLRYIAQSNQFVIFSATSGHDEEIASQLKLRAEKTQVEMLANEAALKAEIRKLDSLRTYQSAQQELDELNLDPVKRNVEALQHDLGPQEHAPAEIVEPATAPTRPGLPEGTPKWTYLGSGGFALVLGVALIMLARKPASQA